MAQIVASVFAESPEQVAQAGQRAAMASADWLELRLDRWPVGADLGRAFAAVHLPILVACRTPEVGGQFRGTLLERRQLLLAALDAGAQGLDLELGETWQPPPGRPRVRLMIRSFHSFTGVPKELANLHAQLHQQPGSVAKLVVTAHDLADAAPVLELLQAVDQRATPTVAFAMGRTAWPTRVLAALLGAPFVYGCLDEGSATAPGQVPVDLLAGLYRVRDLGPATALYGLLGNPALGSLGPWLHNRAFRRLGHDGLYLPFETSRPAAVLGMLPRRQLRGLSVTAPWKEAMVPSCHQLGEEALACGVVNTVLCEAHGVLTGHNTDVGGVRAALAGAGVGAGSGRLGVVLGAGGAARAGALALQQLGFQVLMLGRSLEPARAFAKARGIQLGSLSQDLPAGLQPAVVVNATPLGGAGHAGERPLPQWQPKPGTVVLDMVYQPRWTPLLTAAAAAGAVAVPGAEMFLAQAALQVQWFTGQELPVEVLRGFLAGTAAAEREAVGAALPARA